MEVFGPLALQQPHQGLGIGPRIGSGCAAATVKFARHDAEA
jgi:hypothetical protein